MEDPRDTARKEKAEKAIKSKEEGALAMAEYQAEGRAVRAKTARLKALRLEKEAREKAVAGAKKKTVKRPLTGRASTKSGTAKAAEMAGQEIDRRLKGTSATDEQRASRKRRLLKGPKEFREIRDDLSKRKR